MGSIITRLPGLRLCLFALFTLLLANEGIAQTASQYGFTAVAGTFTEITGTSYTGAQADDQLPAATIPIGFNFDYCGATYNTLRAGSNGYIAFTSGAGQTAGNTSGNLNTVKPALLWLWDDLDGANGTCVYTTTGAAPNRVFTIQFKNWEWNWSAAGPNLSVQVKLYETTNVIEYVYRQESQPGNPTGSGGATIGICDAGATPTYLSLDNTSASPTASSTTFTINLGAKPATGQIYRFTPPVNCSAATGMPTAGTVTATPGTICVSGNVTLSFAPATPMPPVIGITYKWQTSPTLAGTYTDIPGAITNVPTYTTVTPISASAFFKCVVLCNGSSTVLTSSASNQVTVTNPGTPTVTPGSRCGPGSVALAATAPAGASLNWYAAPTGGLPLQTGGATFNTPYIPTSTNFYVAAASGTSLATPQIGTATTSSGGSTFEPGPFSIEFRRTTMQLMYTSAEILAAGGGSGVINNIAFNCTGLPIYAIPNYKISIGSVPGTMANLLWQPPTNLTQVYSNASYLPAATGWQTFAFSTPYNYTTGDNIVIQICWDQVQPNWNASGDHQYTTQTGRMLFNWTDNAGSSCGDIGTTTATNLPNIRLNMTLGCEGARVPVMATVNASPVVVKTVPPVVCNDAVATIALTPPTPAYPSYTWTPATNLYTNLAATTPYVAGNSATTVYMKTTNVGQQTYYMMAGNPALTTGCTFADTVKIHVQPGHVNIKGKPDTICVNGSTELSLDTIAGYYAGSIQWQTSTDGVNYTDIAGATNPVYTTPVLAFGQNTYYRAQIRAGLTVCEQPVKYVVVANPTIVSAPDSFHCGPGEVTLSAVTGGNGSAVWYQNATGGLPLASGSPFVTPYLGATTSYYVSSGGGSFSGIQAVGAGANVSTTQSSTPFSSGWGGSKHQYLIRASELIAAGIPSGSEITSLALDVVAGGVLYPGFAISMKNTATTALTTTYETGTVEVKAPANHNTTVGVNTFTLTTPFLWDGTSNLLIQTCWSNATANSTGSTVRIDNTTFVSSRRGQSDNLTPANMCGATTSSSTATYSQRPKFTLGFSKRCESAREEVIAYIRPVPVVDLGDDINKCIDPGYAEVLDAGVQQNVPEFLWDNGSTSQVRSVTESGTYMVTVTNEYTCKDSDTINVILRANPVVDLGNDTTVCNGVLLNLNPGNNGIEYFWNTGQTTQNINVSSAGTYSVFVTNSQGCTKADTIIVNMQGELPTIQGIQATNNGLYTFQFTAVNPQNVIGYDWDFGDGSTHSYQASPTHTYPDAGNYIVVLRLSSTCGFFSDSSSAHILGINQLSVDKEEMTVYPNPTKEMATILNRGALKMENIEVYNVLGQVVYKSKADSKDKHSLRVDGFASGVYTIQIFTDKGTVARKLEIIK